MTAYRTIQQELRKLCRDSIDPNNDELLLLKNILKEINQKERLYLIDAEDDTHRAPLFYAIESGKSLDFLRQLLEYQVRITNRILLCAIRYGNLDILKLLHQYGADFRQSYHGLSLLHECILLHKNHLITFLIEEGGVSIFCFSHTYRFFFCGIDQSRYS
jgi:ankyrin repeat protein